MTRQTRRILRTTLAIVGTLETLLGIAYLVAFTALQRRFYDPAFDYSAGIHSGFLYLSIGVISFAAVWRLKPNLGNASETSTGR